MEAKMIGLKDSDTRAAMQPAVVNNRPVYLRRGFCVKRPVKRATVRVTALGIYRAFVNSAPISDIYFAPGWTDYRQRLYVQTCDVTSQVRQGENVISAIVADGWYAGKLSIIGCGQYGNQLGLQLELELWYADGSGETIGTDETWKGALGGYQYADLQTGEYFDARQEPGGWQDSGFDDSRWASVEENSGCFGTRLIPQPDIAVKRMQTLEAISLNRDRNGRWIYDMGQNMVGTVTVRALGEKGQKLILRYGEMLNWDGTLYTENLRTAQQADTYVFGRDGVMEYTQYFTFHGFRYVESSQELVFLAGNVLYSGCAQTGEVQTSQPMVNQLFQNQMWGQRGNFIWVPTDCPQRDERLGWTGDAQIFAKSGCYNMDSRAFYRAYLDSLRDAQLSNGAVPDIVPYLMQENKQPLVGAGTAAWGDAIFVIPYWLYQMYGDMKAVEENYPAMVKYMDYLAETAPAYIRPAEGYGDWLSVGSETPKEVLATAYYAYDAALMAQMTDMLGRGKEAEDYRNLYQAIKAAFIQRFTDEDGTILGDTQCCYVLALQFGLYADKEQAAQRLVCTLERADNHLTTGFVGVSYLLPVLTEAGRGDLAYTLLLNDTYPSWGYSIKNGATTIWERWNSYTIEEGFGAVAMNSFNHYSLGSVAEWMYQYMGGIRPVKPGFEKVRIQPFMDARVPEVSVKYQSVKGEIAVSYSLPKKELLVVVPKGCEAEIFPPVGSRLCGALVDGAVTVQGGTYEFTL